MFHWMLYYLAKGTGDGEYFPVFHLVFSPGISLSLTFFFPWFMRGHCALLKKQKQKTVNAWKASCHVS